MSINDIAKKIKGFIEEREKDIFIGLLVLVTALGSFGLGRLSRLEERKTPIKIENINNTALVGVNSVQEKETKNNNNLVGEPESYVASKNSTKYHRLDCPGAKAIKDTNKIWFTSIEEARKAGFTPAGNCPGLK